MKFEGNFHCLHGFLGTSSDWDGVLPKDLREVRYDLFSKENSGVEGLWGFGRIKTKGPNFLVGYSLGGRLALQALIDSPSDWSGAVLISTHPGLPSEFERESRLKADQSWAHRFRDENWDSLIQSWNDQPVLRGGGVPRVRKEEDFSREALAEALETRSLGLQKDYRSVLKALRVPILWISGELDVKFRLIAEEMATLNSCFQARVVAGAGHRVPWNQPEVFQQAVIEYLKSINVSQ